MSTATAAPRANQDTPNPRRPKRGTYNPKAETLALLKASGNPINGLGETTPRRPSPFFWHPPDQHPFGELQLAARQNSRKCPGSMEAFQAAYNYTELVAVARNRNEAPPRNSHERRLPSRLPMRPTPLELRPWIRSTFLRDTPSMSRG
jgi:hypothetical protein